MDTSHTECPCLGGKSPHRLDLYEFWSISCRRRSPTSRWMTEDMSTWCHTAVLIAALRGWVTMTIEARAPEVVEMAVSAKLTDMLAPPSEPGSLRSGPT